MKRYSTFAIIGAAALVLAACGSGGDNSSTDDTNAAPGESTTSTDPADSTDSSDDGESDDGETDDGETDDGGDASDGGEGGTVTIVVSADPGNLDPHMTALSSTLQFDQFLYDKLLGTAPDGSLVPRLAESWDSSSTEATFTLREGITCSDGTPLTATTAAENISWAADPENGSSSLGLFVPPMATAVGDDATRTVTVTSPAPNPFLAETLGGFYIVCADGMADRDLLATGGAGTGMYTLTESLPGDHYTLTKRSDYAWGTGADFDATNAGPPDTVIFKIVENESTATSLLLAGDANAVQVVGPDRERLDNEGLFESVFESLIGELWFNHTDGLPTADEQTRIALIQAIDTDQLRAVVAGANGSAPTGLINAGMSPCTEDNVSGNLPSYDPAAAQATLGGSGIELTLYYPSSMGPSMQSGAEFVQAVWNEAGASVSISPMTDAEMGQIMLAGEGHWDAGFVPVGLPLPSQLVPFVSGPTAPDGQNFPAINNADYDAAAAAAMEQIGPAGCADWDAAEVALFKQADVLPFANSTVPWFGQGITFETDQGAIEPSSIRIAG